MTKPKELRFVSSLPRLQTAWQRPASSGRAAGAVQLARRQPDVAQRPLKPRWTYCHWCGRRCSPKETATTPCGVPVHYPCLELHISRCRDCRIIVDKDELTMTTDEGAVLPVQIRRASAPGRGKGEFTGPDPVDTSLAARSAAGLSSLTLRRPGCTTKSGRPMENMGAVSQMPRLAPKSCCSSQACRTNKLPGKN